MPAWREAAALIYGEGKASGPEEGGEGVRGGCACGVMEDFAVKPSLPLGSRTLPDTTPGMTPHMGTCTGHPALMAKGSLG